MTQHISDLMNVDNLSVAREEKQTYTTLNPLSVKLVEYVFAKFYVLCRGTDALFADPKRLLAEKTQWQANFTRENYTSIEHIRKALLKLERYTYANPPQLGQFLSWNESTPEDLGLLTKEQAFNRSAEYLREGTLKGFSDQQNLIMEIALNESDKFFMRNNPITKTQPIFYRNYEIAVRNFLQGKIESIPKGLEDKHEQTVEINKQAQAAKGFDHLRGYEENMPEIRRMVGMSSDGTTSQPVKRQRL